MENKDFYRLIGYAKSSIRNEGIFSEPQISSLEVMIHFLESSMQILAKRNDIKAFTMAAMQGILACPDDGSDVSKLAINHAKATLEALEKAE